MRVITDTDVREALRPYIGSPVADHSPRMMALAADTMNARQRESLESVAEELEHILFNGLYDALGEQMTLRRDNGEIVRVYLRMLPEVVDLAMFPLMDAMDPYRVNFYTLQNYYVRTGSLSALIVLQRRYTSFQDEEENRRQRTSLTERIGEEACARLLDRPSKG